MKKLFPLFLFAGALFATASSVAAQSSVTARDITSSTATIDVYFETPIVDSVYYTVVLTPSDGGNALGWATILYPSDDRHQTLFADGLKANLSYELSASMTMVGPPYSVIEEIQGPSFTTLANTIGIDEKTQNILNVFPNPTTSMVAIEGTHLVGEMVKMIDPTGKVVKTIQIIDDKVVLDLSALPSGMYIMQIGNVSKRIVKQ